jgi:hypothetical protein
MELICEQCRENKNCRHKETIKLDIETLIEHHSYILLNDSTGNQKEYLRDKIMDILLSRCRFVDRRD